MRRAAKIDSNQNEIVQAFRKCGAAVIITAQLKNAFDLLVLFQGKTHIVEVKDGAKPPSAQKLTDGERKCRNIVEGQNVKYNIITSVDQAIKLLTQTEKSYNQSA